MDLVTVSFSGTEVNRCQPGFVFARRSARVNVLESVKNLWHIEHVPAFLAASPALEYCKQLDLSYS